VCNYAPGSNKEEKKPFEGYIIPETYESQVVPPLNIDYAPPAQRVSYGLFNTHELLSPNSPRAAYGLSHEIMRYDIPQISKNQQYKVVDQYALPQPSYVPQAPAPSPIQLGQEQPKKLSYDVRLSYANLHDRVRRIAPLAKGKLYFP